MELSGKIDFLYSVILVKFDNPVLILGLAFLSVLFLEFQLTYIFYRSYIDKHMNIKKKMI